MSADLFAAFGEGSSAAAQSHRKKSAPDPKHVPLPGSTERQSDNGNQILFDADIDNDEDEFGEFESGNGEPSSVRKEDITSAAQQSHTWYNSLGRPANQVLLVDLFDSNMVMDDVRGHQSRPVMAMQNEANTSPMATMAPLPQTSTAVEDEWGDFEAVRSSQDHTVPSSHITSPKSSMSKKDAPVKAVPRQATPSSPIDDDWQPFDDDIYTSPVQTTRKTPNPKPDVPVRKAEHKDIRSALKTAQATTPQTSAPTQRPTNIPPPAVLLQLLVRVSEELGTSKSNESSELERAASEILTVHDAASRIIAGRSLRWKRDTILAQSMKISQAGKSGGMKLTTVNKGESIKEDSEIADTVAAWTKRLHDLNSITSRAKLARQHPPNLRLNPTIPVRIATGPAVLSASHICPLCGLMRNERVPMIDFDVQDAFGEFWVEFWGHRTCHDFWYQYSSLLAQR